MFKRVISLILTFICIFSFSVSVFAKSTYVSGYYRKDGTYVRGHWRNYSGSSSSHSNSKTYSSFWDENDDDEEDYKIYEPDLRYRTVSLYKGENYVGSEYTNKLVFVQGYYREDGTYVRPHWRTNPDDYIHNNFSYSGYSTLTPKESKRISQNFDFTRNSTCHAIESYLIYNTVQLTGERNSKNDDLLSTYANKLQSSPNSISTEESGIKYYTTIGLTKELAKSLVKYDITSNITPEIYLLFTLSDKLTLDEIRKIEVQIYSYSYFLYLNSIRAYQEKSDIIMEGCAELFYKGILEDSEIKSQVELDCLQIFGASNFNQEDIDSICQALNIFLDSVRRYSVSDDQILFIIKDNYKALLSTESL